MARDAEWLRLMAAALDARAAALRAAAAMTDATAALGRLAEAWAAAESREVAEHPDLAELNVRMDALYDWS